MGNYTNDRIHCVNDETLPDLPQAMHIQTKVLNGGKAFDSLDWIFTIQVFKEFRYVSKSVCINSVGIYTFYNRCFLIGVCVGEEGGRGQGVQTHYCVSLLCNPVHLHIVFVLLYSACRSVSLLSCVDVIQSFTYVYVCFTCCYFGRH